MKKVLFDSNVLVASLWDASPEQARAYAKLEEALVGKVQGFLCQHAMLEFYSTLTKLPVSPPNPPGVVVQSLRSIIERVTVVALGPSDYQDALDLAQGLHVLSGTTYDLLHVISARKCEADELVTLNVRHFERLLRLERTKLVEP